MKNLFMKIISLVVVITMMASMGVMIRAYEYPDEGYWANEAINAAIANGLLRGKEDGKMHSEDNLTRAEMAAIMVRSFGATVKADVKDYVDLNSSAWYYEDFAKAVQMRVFEGDGTGHMRPNDFITREEVFTVVARALVLNDTNYSALEKFKDNAQISSWAKGYMSILTQKSYVNGDDLGNVNPKKSITRAEFAQLMHNIFRNYYSKADTYTGKTDNHSSMINTGNVTFKNVTIDKDLVIGDGDAKGTIRLENVNIKGRLLVRGSNRVELVNTTVGEMVVVNNYNTVVHFDNYRDEKVFDGIILNTEATFKEKAKPTGGGGGTTTKSYTVTYDTDGGTPVANGKAYKDKTFILPGANSTTKTGYTLKGWMVNGTEYAPGASVTGINSNITVKAVWKLETYTITYDVDGGSAITPTTVEYGKTLTLPAVGATTKTGYTLVGWMVKGIQYNPGDVVSDITADTEILAVWKLDEYTITYDVDGGSEIPDGKAYYGVDFTLPGMNATTKTGYTLVGWEINGTKYGFGATISGITTDTTVKAVWEAVAPETKYGSYVIKYYKQNSEGQYDYVDGDDEDGTVEVGEFTITVNSTKYDGYILSTSNVYTLDIVEGQTTVFKVYYDLKVDGVEYNTVTFYYRTNVVGTTEVESGSTVTDAQFPDYMKTYTDGYVKDTSVSPVYETPYQHTVNYGWWFNAEADKWKEFTNETVVNSDMDVYLKIQKFNTIITLASGEQFNFYAFYESDTRFIDTVKDLLYKRGILEALKVSGYMDKVREKGVVQKVLDTDDNIMMFSYMVKFSTILGEENVEKFIVDNAKEMFASGNNELLHDAFVEYIIAVSNSDNPDEKKKVHDLMEETINHVFEEDEVSTETLDLIKELCNEALSDPDTFKEVTGYDYSSLSTDTRTFVTNYIIDELCKNDKLFAEVVKEVTGVDYTETTTTKDLIIAMAEKQLSDNFGSTIDGIKDSQKTLIVTTVESMLNDNSNGLYNEVLTYAVENEKDVIVTTIKTLLAQEDSLYDEVVNFIVNDATYKPMLTDTVSDLLTDSNSTMYDDVMGIVASDAGYRAIVAEEIGNKLATDDALFEALTGYNPVYVPDRADAIDTFKDEITNNQSSFEDAITKAETAGYKSFITDSIVDELETNDTFFNSVFAEAKDDYRSEIVDTISTELGKTGNESLLDDVVGYAKDDYKATIVGVMVDKLEEDNSPMYDKVIELAKTDAYKQTIVDAIVNEMKGPNGDSLITAITGATDAELAKDPQAKDGYIMNKAEELLGDNDYFDSIIESVTGDPDYMLPATPKDFIIDLVVIELMDTESASATRDLIIEEAIAYLLETKDEDEISHLADYAISYLGNHPDERDALVDEIINDVYKDEVDKLVYQLINEEQFEVRANTVFVAEGLKTVLLRDYNYETLFGSKIPEKLEKVFEIYPEEKLIELYDFAINDLISQIDTAIETAVAGGTGYIDSGITPVINIIDDIYVPLYDSYKKIIEGPVDDKIGGNFYYSENIYLQELMKLLDPTVWVQGSANAKPSDTTGYKIYDLDYYYDLMYKIYVLGDDAILWYYDNLIETKYMELTEKYEELILKYVNVIADKVDIYVIDGEVPKVNEKVDDKISAVEKAIVEKYPELVKGLIDKYKSSKLFNKDYTEVDYDKVRDKVYDLFVRTLNLTTDEYFDLILNQEAYEDLENKVEDKVEDKLDGKLYGEYYTKIDDNTYKFEVNDYIIRFIRELKNTLY